MDMLAFSHYMSVLASNVMATVALLVVAYCLFEIFDLLWSKFCSNDSDNSSNPEN
jgi:hypothetical protein